MTDRRSIKEVIEQWLKEHPRSKSTPRPVSKSIYFQLQAVTILIAVFSLYHYPPVLALPHADVLILDMTQAHHDSLSLLLTIINQAHLSTVVYDSVSVNLVRLIPTGNYHYIVLWGHSGINDMATTEPYSPFHHVTEQLTGGVGKYLVHGHEYFSIAPGLINEMQGTLHGSVVLLMGCNTLTERGLARAFIEKGSSIVVGWTGLVPLQVTDIFTVSLFQMVLQQHKPAAQAFEETSSLLASMGILDLVTSVQS